MPEVKKDEGQIPVILAIDHGTTYTRVCLHEPVSGEMRSVEEDPQILALVEPYSPNVYEFGAFCDPFGRDTISGAEAAVLPTRVALKTAALVLDDSKDVATNKPRYDHLNDMPNGKRLVHYKDQPSFRLKIRALWTAHFKHIRDQIEHLCKKKGWEVTKIVVTLPNWMNDEQVDHIYIDLIKSVFPEVSKDAVISVGEAEAIAHYVIHEDIMSELDNRNIVMMIDIGGTSFNGCLLEVWKSGNAMSIAELDHFGVLGGGEIWEMSIADEINQMLATHRKRKRGVNFNVDNLLKGLLRQFNRHKHVIKSPDAELHYTVPVDDKAAHSIKLSPPKSKKCFNEGFKEGLALVKEKIAEAAKLHGSNFGVIFSGGATKAKCIYEHLTGIIDKVQSSMKLEQPIPHVFTKNLQNSPDKSNFVAKGAALIYAAYLKKTVEDFMQDGAAFGVQVYDQDRDGTWPLTVQPLCGPGVPSDVVGSYPARGKLDFRIICDPFYGRERQQDGSMRTKHCYDILDLSAGDADALADYTFRLQYSGAQTGIPSSLRLLIDADYAGFEMVDTKNGVRKQTCKRTVAKDTLIPLTIHPGTLTVLPISEKIKHSAWKKK